MLLVNKEEINYNDIVSISEKNQVLCEYTAFICIIDDNKDKVMFNPDKVGIPSIDSVDYGDALYLLDVDANGFVAGSSNNI